MLHVRHHARSCKVTHCSWQVIAHVVTAGSLRHNHDGTKLFLSCVGSPSVGSVLSTSHTQIIVGGLWATITSDC